MRKDTHRALDLALAGGFLLLPALVAHSGTSGQSGVERERLREHVVFLASDDLRGRGTGTPGLEQAAEYVASRFRELALLPAGDEGTYFQSLRVAMGAELEGPATLVLRDGESGTERSLASPDDLQPLTFSASAELEAPVVFIGYGVTAPELGYDDYEGVDVRGKVVLMLRYVPGRDTGPFAERTYHATFVRKAENAYAHGAKGMVLVNGPLHLREDRLVSFGVEVGSETLPLPALHARRALVDDVLSEKNVSLRELQKSIDERIEPRSFELAGVRALLRVAIERKSVTVPNVLGYLPSSGDSATRPAAQVEQYVVLGAHYDHLGLGEKGSRDRRSKGKIHNGADDNASGVAGVIELARLLSAVEERPRGVLFAAFAAEELGLHGSAHYTRNPTIPLERAVAMINLDMIGRLRHDRIYIGGLHLVPDLENVVARLLGEQRLQLSRRFSAETASDHASFLRAGIPSLFLFTGLHGDYHKPTDDVQFLNLEGMKRVVDLSYRLSEHLLRVEVPPRLVADAVEKIGKRELRGDAYLGIGIDRRFDGEGIRIAYVAQGGPADRAGLRAGDVLLEIDGHPMKSAEKASRVLRELRPGERVSARVRRAGVFFEARVRVDRWP